MFSLELFRANHGDEEIGKEQQRDDAGDDGLHRKLKFIAEADVKGAHEKKQNHHSAKDEIVHTNFGLSTLEIRAAAIIS
jgi:hypothetical protein